MLKISENEITYISKLNLKERYTYFLKRICDQQKVCLLKNEHTVFEIESHSSDNYVHLWSAIEFGEKFIKASNKNSSTSVFDFEVLTGKCAEFIKLHNAILSIMPINENVGYVISIEQLLKDIEIYNEEWYG